MQTIYNSPRFCVVEFVPDAELAPAARGYEILDKSLRREAYINGDSADRFRRGVQALIDSGSGIEELDAFLGDMSGLMNQPLVLH